MCFCCLVSIYLGIYIYFAVLPSILFLLGDLNELDFSYDLCGQVCEQGIGFRVV